MKQKKTNGNSLSCENEYSVIEQILGKKVSERTIEEKRLLTNFRVKSHRKRQTSKHRELQLSISENKAEANIRSDNYERKNN